MSLTESFQKRLRNIPAAQTAIIDADQKAHISYGELWEQASRLSSNLRQIGLRQGDRVILALQNSIPWVIGYLAIIEAGGIVVPVRLRTKSYEMKGILKTVKPSLMLSSASYINRLLPSRIFSEDQEVVITAGHLRKRHGSPRVTSLQALIFTNHKTLNGDQSTRSLKTDQRTASINFTYRGLGKALGATLTHSNYLTAIQSYILTVGLREGQRVLASLPFSHTYPLIGCLLAPLFAGGIVIITKPVSGKGLSQVIDQYRCEVLAGIPMIYQQLLHSSVTREEMRSVKTAICGASSLSLATFQCFRERYQVDIRQGYGLTECFAVTCNPVRIRHPQSVGQLMVGAKGLKIRIVDAQGNAVPIGQIGEIIVTGPTVMSGYYNESDVTQEVLQDDWLYTGDWGRVDQDGYVFLEGLKKRITKVAGNLVDLTEVESEIRKISGVLDIEVSSIPDEWLGTMLRARVGNQALLTEEKHRIRNRLKLRLASYKIPMIWTE